MKLVVFVLSGAIGFYLAFGWSSGVAEEAEAYGGGTDGIAMSRCVRQMEGPAQSISIAQAVCGCMMEEFGKRGLEVTDAFGSDFDQMQAITNQCAATYAVQLGG